MLKNIATIEQTEKKERQHKMDIKNTSAIESALFAFQREKSAQMGERYDREMLEQWKNESPENYEEELTCMKCAINVWGALCGVNWQPIATAPKEEVVFLAVYIIPSEEAARNGSREFWDYGIGSHMYGDKWSGILGGLPSHWARITPPFIKEEKENNE